MGFEKRVTFFSFDIFCYLTFYAVFGWEQDLFCFALFLFVLNQALLFKTISIFLFLLCGSMSLQENVFLWFKFKL